MEAKEEMQPVVLLVIDDWLTRALIHAQLDEDGFEVHTSLAVPQTLIRLSRRLWPALAAIVVDVADRTVNEGFAGCLATMATHAPVIALTGSFGPKPDDLVRMGARSVLRRPVTVGQVSRAVRELVQAGVAEHSGPGIRQYA